MCISPWNVNFIFFFKFYLFLCMGVLSVSMFVLRVSAWRLKRPEKVPDVLKLEWQAIVNCDVGVGL